MPLFSKKPLKLSLGIFTLLSFLATVSVALMHRKGIRNIPFKWHPRLAVSSICLHWFMETSVCCCIFKNMHPEQPAE